MAYLGILIQHPLEFAYKGPINDKSILAQVNATCIFRCSSSYYFFYCVEATSIVT